jgi:hypothetical protein
MSLWRPTFRMWRTYFDFDKDVACGEPRGAGHIAVQLLGDLSPGARLAT